MKVRTTNGLINVPNNPMQAYLMGKRHGTQENMDLVSMALLDKCGFHTRQDGPDDTQSIEYVYRQIGKYAEEINEGRMKRREIKDMLAEEAGIEFRDGGDAE